MSNFFGCFAGVRNLRSFDLSLTSGSPPTLPSRSRPHRCLKTIVAKESFLAFNGHRSRCLYGGQRKVLRGRILGIGTKGLKLPMDL
jgi:hypothetical protein